MNPPRLHRPRRLQHRLFGWFAASIAITAVTVVLVVSLVGRMTGPGGWRHEFLRTRTALAHHVARVWDQPAEVQAFTVALAEDLDAGVRIVGEGGQLRAEAGPTCEREWATTPILRNHQHLGDVVLCPPSRPLPWRLVLGLVIAVGVLWAAAGHLARRLAQPLAEVARVTEAIGQGLLDARVRLHRGHIGEVQVVAEAVNDMAARIERQLAEQRELLASVSHELRTPLGHLRLLAELAHEGGASEHVCREMDRELDELDDLVGQLLATARLDFTALSTQRLDATQLAIRALERAGADASVLQVDAPGAAVQGDATLLMRALANLLDNARRHGGRLQALRVSQQGSQLVFEVEDDGPGFAPGEEVRAFERFRAGPDGQTHDGSSLGLGLHLVARIAQAHQGQAFAENRAEGGARVGLRIAAVS
jgi:two-component system OmpR family sensor kinase